MPPRTLILRTAGTNCDRETAHAFELAGALVESIHVNRLLEDAQLLHKFQILAIPGGFSYGDDIAAGRILANQIAHHLKGELARFVNDGKPIIGVCNGFQVLVKTDLLPGPLVGATGQNCTLAHNDCGRFIDRWVHVRATSRKCIWTVDLDGPIELPIAHGEGKFVAASEGVRRALHENDQVALSYCRPDGSPAASEEPFNPNGSTDDIAGICDATGLVFGLMPHPERHVTPLQHPSWTRLERHDLDQPAPGLRFFRNAVRHVSQSIGAGV